MIKNFKFNKYTISLIVAVYFIMLQAVFAGSEYCKKELTMGWEYYPPYELKNDDGTYTGIYVDVVTAILEKIGCKVVDKELPWARQLKGLETGDLDLVPGAFKTPEREAYAHYTDSYLEEEAALFVAANSDKAIKINSFDDMITHNFRLGIVRGYEYGVKYHKAKENPNFVKLLRDTTVAETNYTKLLNSRIDGMLQTKDVGIYELKQKGLYDKIVKHHMKISTDPIYSLFSKKSVDKRLTDDFNKALKEIRDNGEYQAILKKYE